MKKLRLMLVLVIMVTLGAPVQENVAHAKTFKNYDYELLGNGTVKITGYHGKAKKLTIPKIIKGMQVTEIGEFCFQDNNKIKTLVIPEGVQKLEELSLYSMLELKDLTIPQTITSMTDCGIGWYSEASDHPKMTFHVVKGSKAFKYVVKKHSNSKIKVAKKTKATVVFNANGGYCNKRVKCVKKGAKLGKLPVPVSDEAVFLGWYTKKTGGKKITAKTKIKSTKNVTYYARWEALEEDEEDVYIQNAE